MAMKNLSRPRSRRGLSEMDILGLFCTSRLYRVKEVRGQLIIRKARKVTLRKKMVQSPIHKR